MGDDIRMDLKEIDINTRNWVDSVQDRGYWRALVNVALNLRVPYAMELVFHGNRRFFACETCLADKNWQINKSIND